jgi:hypothetical protein
VTTVTRSVRLLQKDPRTRNDLRPTRSTAPSISRITHQESSTCRQQSSLPSYGAQATRMFSIG